MRRTALPAAALMKTKMVAAKSVLRRAVRVRVRSAAAAARKAAPDSPVTAAFPSAAMRNTITASMRSAANAVRAVTAERWKRRLFGRLFFRKRLPFSAKCCTLKRPCGRGGTGRRAGLRIRWATLQVQILSPAPCDTPIAIRTPVVGQQ